MKLSTANFSTTLTPGSRLIQDVAVHRLHLAARVAAGALLLEDEDEGDGDAGEDDDDDWDRDGGVLAPGLFLAEAVLLLLVPPVLALVHALELLGLLVHRILLLLAGGDAGHAIAVHLQLQVAGTDCLRETSLHVVNLSVALTFIALLRGI